jgi:hypothetical protein
MPKRYNNIIYKLFLKSKRIIKVILNSITRIRLIIFIKDPKECHSTDLTCTVAHCSILFPTVSWPTTSALAVNLAYLYMLPLYTFFFSLYHNVVIQSTSLQYCDSLWYL